MPLFDADGMDPRRFVADFYESFHHALIEEDEDLASAVDRFHTPDVLQTADGHVMDREKLIAHCRPTRKKKPSNQVEVVEAMGEGDRVSARLRMQVARARGERVDHLVVHVHFFGQFADDGRMRHANMLTRTETAAGAEEPAARTARSGS